MPAPQTEKQRRVEARITELGGELGKRHGMTRRRFLATASGMAAAFLAMNEVYGPLYRVSPAEAADREMAAERVKALKDQFVMDCHTHFLRDDTRIMTFVRQRQTVGKAGWNPALAGKEQTLEDLKFANYYKEVFLDSDTKVALLSGSPSEVPQDWFLTNEMKAEARAGEQGRGLAPHAEPRDLHPGLSGLARTGRSRDPRPQAGLVQGLYDRRQYQQEPQQAPVADGRRQARLSVLREAAQGGLRQGLRPQGTLPALRRAAVPAPARILRRARRRQGGQGLAEDELRHLSRRLPLRRWRQGRGRVDAVREDGAHRVGDRPRRHPVEVRREQRLRRRRPALRPDHHRRSARVGGDDGHARPRTRRRPRGVGHRRHLDGLAPVADRGAPAARDSRGHAEAARLQAARPRRRPGQEHDPGRDQRAALQVRAARRAGHRPHRRAEGGVRAGGEPAEQPALRLRGGGAGLTGARATRIAGRGGDSVTTRPRARGAGR